MQNQVSKLPGTNNEQAVNTTATLADPAASKNRLQATRESVDLGVAKPVHGEDGECCGGCGG